MNETDNRKDKENEVASDVEPICLAGGSLCQNSEWPKPTLIDGTSNSTTINSRDWESGLYAGLMLSLDKYKERLKEERAYKLNARPREIDIRIIDQEYVGDDRMDNAIAYLFERHNLIELKDPYEELDIDVVWTGISYAAQYKGQGYDDVIKKSGVDIIPMKDVTITFLRVSKPRDLFKQMKNNGYGIEEKFPGVYYITGIADIKIQVVVGRELEGEEFVPIRIQKKNAADEDVRTFLKLIEGLKDIHTKNLADSVMQISISENEGLYNRLLQEDPGMCKALRELMNDQIEKEKSEAVNEAVNNNNEYIARKMIEIGDPLDKISKVTSVTIERLEELSNMLVGTTEIRG